jgi:hypothetical protein
MSIVASLSGLSAAVNLGKSLRDTLKHDQLKPEEVIGRLGEIIDHIVDGKIDLAESQDEIRVLEEKIRALNDESAFRDSLAFDNLTGVYKRTKNGIEEVFCSTCLDQDNKRVRVTMRASGRTYLCHTHGYRQQVS